VFDPQLTVIQVGNFATAAQGIATTGLRAVIGDLSLDEALTKRDRINQVMRTKLDEVTERWGVKVTTVEIREITPPKDAQDAMTRQMSAGRSRRALVTEADGKKQAAITIAEGEKQSAILKAEGDRQAAILRAEGFSLGPATKIVFPMEFTKLLQPFVDGARGTPPQRTPWPLRHGPIMSSIS
jgi:regulator of protease activity HflC (stomatin/prohibitin superfamily)